MLPENTKWRRLWSWQDFLLYLPFVLGAIGLLTVVTLGVLMLIFMHQHPDSNVTILPIPM